MLIGLLVAADLVAFRGRVHPGVEFAGVDLGGETEESAARLAQRLARDVGSTEIRFVSSSGRVFRTTPAALGWRPDASATVARAMAVGRGDSALANLRDRLVAWWRPTEVAWAASWNPAAVDRIAREWTDALGDPPREGSVRVVEGVVVPQQPANGSAVDGQALLDHARAVVSGSDAVEARLPLIDAAPLTTTEDVTAAAAEVERLLEGPVTLAAGEASIELDGEGLGPLVRTGVRGSTSEDAELRVRLRPAGVAELLAPHADGLETAPRSARFEIEDGRVRVVPAERGTAIDPALAARDLLAAASDPSRTGSLRLAPVAPDLTTKEAKALGVTEEISSFTTYHAAGEPRVINIHLAADILDGALIMPGETFSLNERLGERTAERGFVEAPVIYDGEFTTDIGGGVSQLATTTFNAAFFAGYPFEEYKAHSYYISRYPMGREATVSWPGPDLVFRNDTDTAAVITTDYTGSSITVRIFGTDGGRTVRATEPEVVSRDAHGFTVLVERIVRQGADVVRRDTFRTFYRYE